MWCIYCDAVCLDFDGNLFDCALISLISALRNARLPQIVFDNETEQLVVSEENENKLNIQVSKISLKPIQLFKLLLSNCIYCLNFFKLDKIFKILNIPESPF